MIPRRCGGSLCRRRRLLLRLSACRGESAAGPCRESATRPRVVAVIAQHEDASLGNRYGVVEPLADFQIAAVSRLEGVALVKRFAVYIDDAEIKINVHGLSAGCNDALDDRAVQLRLLRRVNDDDVALPDRPVEEVAFQNQIVVVEQRGIHRASLYAHKPEQEHKYQRDCS